MWGERPSPNMALAVGNGSGQLHSWTNPASPGFRYCEDILMPECKYDVLLSKSWYLKVSQSLVYMDHQFCISGAPFITWLRRSNYWDTSTTGPQRRWSSSAVDYASWGSEEERSRLSHSTMEDNVYLHRVRNQMPVGRIEYFQAFRRSIINKAE